MSEPSTQIFHGKTTANRIATYFAATRPAFLTASLFPVLAALAMVWGESGQLNFPLAFFTLLNIALIAIEKGDQDVASKALRDASATQLQQADELDSQSVRDAAGATRSHFEGLLSARMGDSKKATAHAEDFRKYVAASNNPQKLQRMHNILGMDAYYQGEYAGAATHLEQGTPVFNMYIKYYLARAHEQAGNKEQADKLYKEMAVYNFNGPGYAMFRKDILDRAAGDG